MEDNNNKENNNNNKKKKVYIIEEKEYKINKIPPPNFFKWFKCIECWDKLPEHIIN